MKPPRFLALLPRLIAGLGCLGSALAQTQKQPTVSYDPQTDLLQLDWQSPRNRTFFPQVSTGLDLWNYVGSLHFGPGTHTGIIQTNAPRAFFRLQHSDLPVVSESEAESADFDADGLSNLVELQVHGTDPLNKDSDRDGLPDGWEVAHSIDPRDDGSIDPANGPGGIFHASAPSSGEGDLAPRSATTNHDAYSAGVQGHPQATLTDKDGDGLPDLRDAGPLSRCIDWETDGSQPRFIYQAIPGYDYSVQGTIVACNDRGDLIAEKAVFIDGVWRPLAQIEVNSNEALEIKMRVAEREHKAYVRFQPNPTAITDDGRIVGSGEVLLRSVEEEVSPGIFVSHEAAGTRLAFIWDSWSSTPRPILHARKGTLVGNSWDEWAAASPDGYIAVSQRVGPSTPAHYRLIQLQGVLPFGVAGNYPAFGTLAMAQEGFTIFQSAGNAYSWSSSSGAPRSLLADSQFASGSSVRPSFHYSEPALIGAKPGASGSHALNFWDKTMIRHEGRWQEAVELGDADLLTRQGIAFSRKGTNSEEVWKGGQKRSLASSVLNKDFSNLYVSPHGATVDGRFIVQHTGAEYGEAFLHPIEVESLDRYVEIGISRESIRSLGGMDQVSVRLKTTDGVETRGMTSTTFSNAYIHNSEREMLGDDEISAYGSSLNPKAYEDTAQDFAVWMEGTKLKLATVFDHDGPIKIEIVSSGNVIASIDYTLTRIADFSDLINVLDATLKEIPGGPGSPGAAMAAGGNSITPLGFFGNLLNRNLITKCMRSVYTTVKHHVVEGVAKVAPEVTQALKVAAIGGQGFVEGLWAGVKDDYTGLVEGVQLFGSILSNPVEAAASFARGFKQLLGLSFEQISQIPQTLVKQFLDQATQDIAWAGPVNNFDLTVYVVAYTTGFITEKVAVAVLTGGATAAAQGVVQGANIAVKFNMIITKIKGAERLVKSVSVLTEKVRAISAMKAKSFRKLTQYVEDKTQVAKVRQYLESRMTPCTP